MKRLRQDRKGLSNIIVFVLGLIIVTMIVTNVFLWNYGMNQLDWERMKEEVEITDVAPVTRSSWFVAQAEYVVNEGSYVGGDYTHTHSVGGSYETFVEGCIAKEETLHPDAEGRYTEWGKAYPDKLAHWDCCDDDPEDEDSSYVETSTTNWERDTYDLDDHIGSGTINWVRVYIRAKLASAGILEIRTMLRTYDNDYESGDIMLSLSYETEFTEYAVNPYTGLAWTWDEIDVLQAGASGRRIGNVAARMTRVWIVVNYLPIVAYGLDLDGELSIDVSTYLYSHIQSIEITLRYRVNDALENWHLRAYNWTASEYSDSGFNNTLGHTPTTGWDMYTVDLTDKWASYVAENGTLRVKVLDNQTDVNRTTIQVDFLAVRAVIDGTRFTFHNKGGLTTRLVSLWVNNSTNHQRYDVNIFVGSGATRLHVRSDIRLPNEPCTVKVVTERGNIAIYLKD